MNEENASRNTKSRDSIARVFLSARSCFACGLSYASWGIILPAKWLGWFQYGNAISILLLLIGGNSPAIAGYWARKQERPALTVWQFLKDIFSFRQSAFAYTLTFRASVPASPFRP